jgi:hypothetical protein
MSFQSLHDLLLEYNGQAAFADVLKPWLNQHTAEVEWLKSIKERTGNPIPSVTDEDLWRLYAASRSFELLVLRFQKGACDGSDWSGPPVSEEEFAEFCRSVGLDVLSPSLYSPFHHEVVGLSRVADPNQTVQLLKYHWPCLMLGPLLFMRAGVTVAAGSSFMAPEVADKSTLYWAYRRKTRPYQDLSHGWGSNSQWRTSFRRDYYLGEVFHFNVDGKVDLSVLDAEAHDDYGLNSRERIELVVNRCFVITAKSNDDLFPYNDRFSMKAR